MEQDILSFLNSQPQQSNWTELNTFLKKNYNNELCEDIRSALVNLVEQKKIVIQENKHRNMCSMVKINPTDHQNTEATLENWIIKAKITEAGKKSLVETEMQWYQTELAKRQFEDHPRLTKMAEESLEVAKKSKFNSQIANIIAFIALLVTLFFAIYNR